MNIKAWTHISSKELYRHPRSFVALEETVRLPNGDVLNDMFVVSAADSAIVVAVTSENSVIFNKQFRNGAQKIMLDLPGGVIDENEDPAQTVIRELEEETGYQARNIKKLGIIHNESMTLRTMKHVFLATDAKLVSKPTLDPREEIEIMTFTWDQIDQKIWANEIQDSATLAALHLARLNSNF